MFGAGSYFSLPRSASFAYFHNCCPHAGVVAAMALGRNVRLQLCWMFLFNLLRVFGQINPPHHSYHLLEPRIPSPEVIEILQDKVASRAILVILLHILVKKSPLWFSKLTGIIALKLDQCSRSSRHSRSRTAASSQTPGSSSGCSASSTSPFCHHDHPRLTTSDTLRSIQTSTIKYI